MAVYDILPNEDLRDEDVRDTLNAHGGKCDNVFGSKFLKRNLNPYSLDKPMSVKNKGVTNYHFELTEEDKRKCNYGYDMPDATDIDEMTRYIRDNVVPNLWENSDMDWGWFYNPPMGGKDDPYRIADFKGYNALQKVAFTFTINGGTVNQLENVFTIAGKFPFSSFSYFDNMYVGVLLAKKTSNLRGNFYVTGIKITEANDVDVILDKEYSKALFGDFQNDGDVWYIAPFLSPEPNIQNIISSESNYLSNVTGARTIPVPKITTTFRYIGTTASDPMNGIKFAFNVKDVTDRRIVMECIATNEGAVHTMNLNIMNYTVELESYNLDDGQYKMNTNGQPSSTLFDTLTIPSGTSVISENMTIGYYPYDEGNNSFKTPYYITIHFSSYMTDEVTDKDAHFALGTARILYIDNGEWEQVE